MNILMQKNKYFYNTFFLKSFILIFLLSLIACETNLNEVVEERFPDGSPKIVRLYKEVKGRQELVSEIIYYPNHNKKIEGEFKNGERHGKWLAWHENGQLQSEGFFKNGKNTGIRKVYYENGNKYYEGKYKNDKPVGEWIFYHSNGSISKKTNFGKG